MLPKTPSGMDAEELNLGLYAICELLKREKKNFNFLTHRPKKKVQNLLDHFTCQCCQKKQKYYYKIFCKIFALPWSGNVFRDSKNLNSTENSSLK